MEYDEYKSAEKRTPYKFQKMHPGGSEREEGEAHSSAFAQTLAAHRAEHEAMSKMGNKEERDEGGESYGEDMHDMGLDYAARQLIQAIQNGNHQAIVKILKMVKGS